MLPSLPRLVWLLLLCSWTAVAATAAPKPRTVVTTDGEVDDVDTFIRMLLYANEFDLEALVYSSSQWHYAGDGQGTRFTSEMPNTAKRYGERTELRWPGTDWMERYIDQYAEVYPTLKQHADGYPTPDYLKSIVRVGNIEFEGEMEKVTPGSEFIKQLLLDDEPGPLYLQIWGGTNTVARALKSIEEEYQGTPQWGQIYRKVSDKAVLYTVLDQDATYQKYVAPHWPEIRVFYNSDQFWSFAYLWPRVVPAELKTYLRGTWFAEHIKFDHGPLLASYFLWGDGQQIKGDPEHTHGQPDAGKQYGLQQYDFISEGDSPAYFFLLDVGLRSREDPSYGGWGGRMVPSPTNPRRWEDGPQVKDYNPYVDSAETTYPQTRWIDVIQNDFAARADWCVQSYEEANHAPTVSVKHALDLTAKPGQKLTLKGAAQDPDGDPVQFRWWQYQEAGTYPGNVTLLKPEQTQAAVTVPADAKPGQTIHLILEGTDGGSPALTRYQRVIVTVK
ncbi:Protein of unknown function [Catalinimonas alkaloidigena]|uniref:DUF1593 domain-containing protein n=1 Tax=Catalinimonas alkaloidigena TaxID=1075417 RepID=A0A1G9RN67_9BACT|nr:DUF1593 domain-containing protein [Catalinimonas alkaloidigena]SDM24736.1 Protein of unknown function [Catalinimonas alkaloidigena]